MSIQTGQICILDTNILVRLVDTLDPLHALAQNAVETLTSQGVHLHTIPQTVFEFWVVATRPVANGGMGLTTQEAKAAVDYFALEFTPFPDDPALLTYWRRLVAHYGVTGKPAHDARYVAAMQAHGLINLLTFDSDFRRYTPEGLILVNPSDITVASENEV